MFNRSKGWGGFDELLPEYMRRRAGQNLRDEARVRPACLQLAGPLCITNLPPAPVSLSQIPPEQRTHLGTRNLGASRPGVPAVLARPGPHTRT